MDVIKTLFTETVKSLESKSEELIKAEILRLEKIVVDLQSKQQLAVDSGAKSDAQLEEIVKATKTRFEENNIKPLNYRHAKCTEDIKVLQKVVLQEGQKVVAQAGVVQKDEQRILQQKERI